jgi:hypothetical protein
MTRKVSLPLWPVLASQVIGKLVVSAVAVSLPLLRPLFRFDWTCTRNGLSGVCSFPLQKPFGFIRRHPCRVGRRIEFFFVGQRGGIEDERT